MKVLLLTAEDINAFPDGTGRAYPKLGLLYLASALRERFGDGAVEIRYHDMLLEGLAAADVGAIVAREQPDMVGISCLSFSQAAFHEVSAAVRGAAPATLIVGGGPYVSSLRESVLDDHNVDVLVFDEGERTFCDLVERISRGDHYGDVPGLAWRRDGATMAALPRQLIPDLDDIPLPAMDLVDLDAYARRNQFIDGATRFFPIVTSRGCPFHCVYCHDLHGKSTRFRSADNVMEEILRLYHDHGVRVLYVYDDIFNVNRDRAKDICRRIIDAKLDLAIDFLNGLRADMMDHELIDLMIEAGTYYFAYAIETATPRLQDLIRKRNKLDLVADAIEYTSERGAGRCVVATYNMIGFPTETEDEVWNTIDFNRSLPHHIADVAVAIPQEHTEMYTMAVELGFQTPAQRSPNYGKDVMLSASEKITPQRLGELLVEFKSAFYDEPRRQRLDELARLDGPDNQRRFLGSFVRGVHRLSGDFVGRQNVALHAGDSGS